jgi:hypothetical protein
MHRRLLLLPLILLAFSGCGSSEEAAVREVVKNYTKAFSERDAKTVCKLLVPKAQMMFQVVGKDCETAMAESLKKTPDSTLRAAGAIRIASVRITGNRAVAEYEDRGGSNQLQKLDGRWAVEP